ncbi:hypothetical protein [Solidesulfovibrio sp. C21]|uniref:hypothetical protein n=1 Tax=Solidesulfovibrio sp. C21 TaxID=3398613 RepID=UPI0039FD42F5
MIDLRDSFISETFDFSKNLRRCGKNQAETAAQLAKIMMGFQRAKPFGRRRQPFLTDFAVVSSRERQQAHGGE